VRGQADQFLAARYVQRAPGRREDVPVLAPTRHEDLHQVDLQQPDRDHRRLADGGFLVTRGSRSKARAMVRPADMTCLVSAS
jgi:hypothetical protein